MAIIKNKIELGINDRRKQALKILEAGLEAVLPANLISSDLQYNKDMNAITIHGKAYYLFQGRIFVIGSGKAASKMAKAIEEIIGPDNITAGVVIDKNNNHETKKIKVITAGHPLPDRQGVKAVEKVLELKEKYNIGEKDLVLCLISGGCSALMPSPVKGINLKQKQETTQLLLECGANIQEINTVRKHLSKTKGGQLAKYFKPASVAAIIISDVVGNKLEVIGSGPTVSDPTTFRDAKFILEQYKIWLKIPKQVRAHIELGCNGDAPETPKEKKLADNYIVGRNAVALEAMALKAKTFGFKPLIVTAGMVGDPQDAAKTNVQDILKGNYNEYDVIFFGGETTPRLPQGYGKGGRNMHFTAVTLEALSALGGEWLMASIDTDGRDYIKEAAGAIIDQGSLVQAQKQKIDIEKYLVKYDTYNLFKELGNSLIKTGETGTNVGDVVMYILK